jgi:hypothetical protein
VSDVSLEENVNELDAYAAQYRTAVEDGERIAVKRGSGEAEHLRQRMPETGQSRKVEPSPFA